MTIPDPLQKHDRGNVLFYILLVIFVLGMLTYYISQTSSQQSNAVSTQTINNQINQMITYASGLGGALQQMVTNGENAAALYSNVDALPPSSDAGFNTAPSNLKIYHPLGGGITYESQSAPNLAVGTNYNINPNAIITGVGCSAASGAGCSATAGHIVFGATISSAAYCRQINYIIGPVSGLTTQTVPPVMVDADFSKLFPAAGSIPSTAAVTAGADCTAAAPWATTASCTGIPRLCVSNTEGTAWGFYADLFPPQNSNIQ
jgi:hypothetical protein